MFWSIDSCQNRVPADQYTPYSQMADTREKTSA